MLAPIVAGSQPCVGVLTLESTENERLDEADEAAFTLLAGHAAWPLSESLHREELTRRESGDRIVDEYRERMLKLATWEGIRQTAQEGLRKLGFHRGFFSKVSQGAAGGSVGGVDAWAWGDEHMLAVARMTNRPFGRYQSDCQVLAATLLRAQIIHEPHGHAHVEQTALRTGKLQPFGIFPLVDSHGIARWTVHLEREDAAPIREYEQKLVERLLQAAMDSWDYAHNRQLEQDWIGLLIGYATRTVPATRTVTGVLSDFIRFLRDNGVVSRGRIFSYLEPVPRCIIFFGDYPPATSMENHPLEKVSETSLAVLEKLRNKHGEPLVVVQSQEASAAKTRGEFDVYSDPDATYMEEFGKKDLTEWTESGIYLEDQMGYKLVLDHKGKPKDQFTLSEMRLISRMARTLSWAITWINAEQLRTELCISGAIHTLKRHQLRNGIESFTREISDRFLTQVEKALDEDAALQPAQHAQARALIADKKERARQAVLAELRSWLNDLEQKLDPLGEKLERVSGLRPVRYSDVFQVVAEIMETYRGHVKIVYPAPEHSGRELGGEGLSLALILLILLQNAVDASDEAPFEVVVTFEERASTIEVRDWGRGLPEKERTAFKSSPRLLHRPIGHGLGLVIARVLARELHWKLRPVEPWNERGTLFRLTTRTFDSTAST